MVYPAMITEYEIFSSCSSVFTLNRKEDPVGLTMTNLGYLNYKMQNKENDKAKEEASFLSYSFQKICEIIFHITNGLKCVKCQHIMAYDSLEFSNYLKDIRDMAERIQKGDTENIVAPKLKCPECGEEKFTEMIKIVVDPNTKKPSLIIDGHVITSKDFDLLRQIVLYQNFPDYADDSWVDPAIREDYEAKMKLRQKKNDVHATLEKKMVALSISTGFSLKQIYEMTIRKFTMALGTVEDLINYKIEKTAASSGFIQLPKGQTIEHWIYKKDKDIYGDSYKDLEEVKTEVGGM